MIIKGINQTLDLLKVILEVLKLSEEDKDQIAENVSSLKDVCDRAVNSSENKLALKKLAARFMRKVATILIVVMLFLVYSIGRSSNIRNVLTPIFEKYTTLANGLWDVLPPLFLAAFIIFFSTAMFLVLVRLMKYEKWVDDIYRFTHFMFRLSSWLAFLTIASTVLVALCTGNVGPFVECIKSVVITSDDSIMLVIGTMFLASVSLFVYLCVVEIPNACMDAVELASKAVKAIKQRKRKRKND